MSSFRAMTALLFAMCTVAITANCSTRGQCSPPGSEDGHGIQCGSATSTTATPSTKLYGRVSQFFAEQGPTFPSFLLSAQKDELSASHSELPEDLIGSWHGDVRMDKVVVSPACAEFSANYAKSITMVSACQQGKAALRFGTSNSGVRLTRGICLFFVPQLKRTDEVEQIFSRLTNLSEQDKERINQALANVTSAIYLEIPCDQRKKERLAYGISGTEKATSLRWTRPAANVFELDSVTQMEEQLGRGEKPQTNYSESVMRFSLHGADSLTLTVANARYGGDKQLLYSDVLSGTFERGQLPLEATKRCFTKITPEANGVRISAQGCHGENISVLVPGAAIVDRRPR